MKPESEEVFHYIYKCCRLLDVSMMRVLSKTRVVPIPAKRHAIMISVRHHFKLTVNEVGKLFERDHSSITHANRRCSDREQPAYYYLKLLP